MPIRVLIVDDSAVMRHMLTELLGCYDDLEVVGTAHDPYIAREKIKTLNPDVLTLDVEMPRMDGLTFLDRLMRLRPMPVVMVSSLTKKNAETTFRALELGAVDFVTKPRSNTGAELAEYGELLAEKLRAAAKAGVRQGGAGKTDSRPLPEVSPILPEQLIVIGASTGGTEALREILCRFPEETPPILVVQHMPEMFTNLFARRLDGLCRIGVEEAKHGGRIVRGRAYIAPGGQHMRVSRKGGDFVVVLDQGPPVNRHRPSVDVLFHSVAELSGRSAVGVILTGMGSDGASGLRALKHAGARTLAQDRATCVVFGMPKAAFETGCVDQVVPLDAMAQEILQSIKAWAANAESGNSSSPAPRRPAVK
jgi:two-component system chemotaxis response regulator CheB